MKVANSREILLMVMYFFCIYRELHCPYEPLNQRMYEAVLNVIGAYFIRKKRRFKVVLICELDRNT